MIVLTKWWMPILLCFCLVPGVQAIAAMDDEDVSAEEAEAVKQVSWEDLALVQEAIVQQYIAASLQISYAQFEMADALELKKQAAVVKAEADALAADSAVDKKRVKAHTKVSKKTNELIQKRLKKKKNLDRERRVQFTKGLVLYAPGVDATNRMIGEFEPFAQSIKIKAEQNAVEAKRLADTARSMSRQSPMELIQSIPNVRLKWPLGKKDDGLTAKFATGVYISKNTPGLFSSHGLTLAQIVKFMQDNDIAVPNDATKALAAFEGPPVNDSTWGNKMFEWAGAADELPSCGAQQGSYCLWIDVQPETARIILPDIKPRYSPGINLKADKYRVVLKAQGYQSSERWVDLNQKSQRISVQLQPEL